MEYSVIRSNIKNIYIQIKEGKVIVKAPKRISEKYIEELVKKKEKWILKKLEEENNKEEEKIITHEDLTQLKNIVSQSAQKYSKNIGEYPKKITIKDMNYAWGSCTGKRNIAINMKLANKRKEIIEYVVLHEICHLKYMNHSKKFWAMVEKYMPDYKEAEKELKK